MNGGNGIFCIFCVFIGIWLIFVDIFTQYNTKLSLKGFSEVLWIKYWNVSNWLSWLLNVTDDIAIFGQCWQQAKQSGQCWQQLPSSKALQTHLDRHKDHTNYLFTVTMPPALTHEQCRHQICALCYCEHGRKADRWISKKEEKLLEDFIPQYCINNPQMPDGICKWWWFCLVKISFMPHLSSNFRF